MVQILNLTQDTTPRGTSVTSQNKSTSAILPTLTKVPELSPSLIALIPTAKSLAPSITSVFQNLVPLAQIPVELPKYTSRDIQASLSESPNRSRRDIASVNPEKLSQGDTSAVLARSAIATIDSYTRSRVNPEKLPRHIEQV